MIVIILATSVLVSILNEIDTALPTNTAVAAVAPVISKNNNKVTVDKFGIRKIYPTKSNGTEWYINMSSPLNDKSFSLSGGGEKTSNSSLANATSLNGHIIKEPDGSYQVYGVRKTGKYDFSVRMNVNASDIAKWWKNIEMTGYVKVVTDTSSGAALDWYARGRLHISSSPCEGVAYHAGLRADGSVYWQKEIWHTGGYTDFRSNITATHSLLGRWVGLKIIMFNINNDSAVRLQTYLDDNATNHWKKVADVVDNGGWYADNPNDLFYSANCGRSKDYIVTNAGPIATFRSDNMIWDFKDLNIREIQPPSDVKVDTIKQLTTNTSSTYNPYVFGNATQEWIDKEHNVKILFSPSPEYPSVGNLTQLGFNVQDLKTGSHLNNMTATVTVINNSTANIGTGISKGTPNGDFSIFKNISAPNGSFSVKDHFLQAGM
ncbi:MAG: hypothetical protein FIO02_09100, partial [Nitrosopumilales archaeon]|nr:hypothetical protein [Nitrosopumilales archaeon]